jgi:hypothetical protein
LSKQNILFRSEIDNFQSRLLEKEKIIAVLISQKREPGIVNGSDLSKSEKTDSLQAGEEGKAFRKQGGNREELDANWGAKSREQNQAIKDNRSGELPQESEKKAEEVKKVAPPPPPRKKNISEPQAISSPEPAPKEVQKPVDVFQNLQPAE